MIWWLVFLTLWLVHLAATEFLVPLTHRANYSNCRLDFTCKLAFLYQQGIWIVALVQQIVWPWIEPPRALRFTGMALMLGGNALVVAARRVNFFFIPVVIYVPPPMRETKGVYRVLRHPGYMGFALAAVGIFLLLGQVLAVLPTLGYLSILWFRIRFEDRVLSGELPL